MSWTAGTPGDIFPWPPFQPWSPPTVYPPILVTPACNGLHLHGAGHVTPFLDREDGHEVLRLRCYCCGAQWTIDLEALRPK